MIRTKCPYCGNYDENGFQDGYRKAQEYLEKVYLEIGKLISTVQIKYIVVTQEKYDEIVKQAKEGEGK